MRSETLVSLDKPRETYLGEFLADTLLEIGPHVNVDLVRLGDRQSSSTHKLSILGTEMRK
jgi:hypothetical protein